MSQKALLLHDAQPAVAYRIGRAGRRPTRQIEQDSQRSHDHYHAHQHKQPFLPGLGISVLRRKDNTSSMVCRRVSPPTTGRIEQLAAADR